MFVNTPVINAEMYEPAPGIIEKAPPKNPPTTLPKNSAQFHSHSPVVIPLITTEAV